MKAAVLYSAATDLVIEDVDIDRPKDHEVLVQVLASGLCHSDMHYISGDLPMSGPTVLGHEVAGIVCEVGSQVSLFRPGDKVVACASLFCAHCTPCITGRTHLCEARPERAVTDPARLTLSGKPLVQGTRVGGFAENILVHQNSLVKVPCELPFDRAALLGCSVLTGLGSVFNSARVEPGSRVAVIGCGGVGLNIVQGARIAGASQIIAVDIAPHKLELAKRFGATDVVTGGPDVTQAVRDASNGGVDFAFEAIGNPATISQAVAMLATSGLLTLVGVSAPDAKADLPVLSSVLHEWRVQGAMMGSAPFQRDIPKFARMYLDGILDLDTLISKRIHLADVNSGFAAMMDGSAARSVIVFD